MYPERAFQRIAGRMTLEGGGKGSAPTPPDYTPIAASNEAAAKVSAEVAREQLAFQKDVYADSKGQQQRLEDLAAKVANQQMNIADENQKQANSQWQYYNQTFKPTEQATVLNSYGGQYLSAEDRAALTAALNNPNLSDEERTKLTYEMGLKAQENAAGEAQTKAAADINSAYGQQSRMLTRMGGDPNKIAYAAAGLANNQALAKVGASNAARTNVKNTMGSLQAGAASFGRNMTNTAGQSYGLATNAGNAAVSNQNTGFMAGAAYPGLLNSGYSNVMGASQQQINANLGLGQLQNQGYATAANMYGQQAAGQGAMMGSAMGMAGMIGAAAL
jgi:hypothetical protein